MDHFLIQRFDLKRPLIFEDMEHGHEVIVGSARTIIRSDQETLDDALPELLSMAKLAETDPLLITFLSQANPSDEELRYLGMFHALTGPLRSAWTWGVMRRIVPEIYDREIAETYAMWEQMHDTLFMRDGGAVRIDDPEIKSQMLSMWAILSENPDYKIELKLQGASEHMPAWDRYLAVIKAFIPQSPDPEICTVIADAADAPYSVRIKTDTVRHYEIKRRAQ